MRDITSHPPGEAKSCRVAEPPGVSLALRVADLAATLVTTWAERLEEERRLRAARRRGATGALAAHWCRYKRVVGETGRIPGFVRYLQEMWEVPSVWLVPVAALGKWGRQLVGTR